jgi:histidyl-tRNA synthetase
VRELLQKDGFADQAIKTFLDIAQRVQELPSAARLAEIEKQLHTVLDARVCKQLASIIESVSPSAGNTIEFDPFLVRGMGYYTGPVFEFVVPGFSGSMGGGGRYDGLIGKLSGTECSACGFSIGFERIVALFGDRLLAATGHVRKIAVFFDDSADLSGVLSAAAELRATGAVASVFTTPKNMKAYLERVKKAGYTDFAKYAPGQSLTPKAIT